MKSARNALLCLWVGCHSSLVYYLLATPRRGSFLNTEPFSDAGGILIVVLPWRPDTDTQKAVFLLLSGHPAGPWWFRCCSGCSESP